MALLPLSDCRLCFHPRLTVSFHPITPLLLQLLAGLVKHGNDSRMTAYQPLLSRRYGFLLLGQYRLEMELDEELRLVTFKFYVENAVGILQQVSGANVKKWVAKRVSGAAFEATLLPKVHYKAIQTDRRPRPRFRLQVFNP